MPIIKEIQLITPKIAKEMLSNSHERQRKIIKRHVEFLTEEMENDRWKFNGDAIRFDVDNNLIDGQHRLNAIIQSGKGFEFLVIKDLPRDVMKTIDLGGMKRTNCDLLSMQGINQAHNITAALNLIIRLKKGKPTDNSKISAQVIFNEYYKCKGIEDGLHLSNIKFMRKLIRPSYIIALYYLFSQINKEKAYSFFNMINTGETEDGKRNSAILLRETLFRLKVNASKNVISRYYELAIIIKAWNFYIDDITPSKFSYDPYREKHFPIIKTERTKKIKHINYY